MAEVYLGTHLTLERPVAVKVMHSHIESDPELQSRFQREAKAVAGLRHSNIVQILDFDTYEGHPYIVMEYLRGPSLSTYLRALHEKKTKLRDDQTGHLMKSLAGGIDYAHAQGIIHRDIKPANILLHNKSGEFSEHATLTRETEPIITDFGLVRIAHSGTQTASGLVSGTPAYMSPEQARAGKVDYRSDIYSLGVVLYELLAGRVPFEGGQEQDGKKKARGHSISLASPYVALGGGRLIHVNPAMAQRFDDEPAEQAQSDERERHDVSQADERRRDEQADVLGE